MPKYLYQVSYTQEGLKGLLNEGGSQRREAVENMVTALAGAWRFSTMLSEMPICTSLWTCRMMRPSRRRLSLWELQARQVSGPLCSSRRRPWTRRPARLWTTARPQAEDTLKAPPTACRVVVRRKAHPSCVPLRSRRTTSASPKTLFQFLQRVPQHAPGRESCL